MKLYGMQKRSNPQSKVNIEPLDFIKNYTLFEYIFCIDIVAKLTGYLW